MTITTGNPEHDAAILPALVSALIVCIVLLALVSIVDKIYRELTGTKTFDEQMQYLDSKYTSELHTLTNKLKD